MKFCISAWLILVSSEKRDCWLLPRIYFTFHFVDGWGCTA